MCCDCTDKNGESKNLYIEKYEAEEQIEYALLTREIKLNMYECPTEKGWHLTSNTCPY